MKKCEWFKSVDWNEVFLKKVEPPKITFRQTEPKEKLNEYDFTNFSISDQTCYNDEFSEF